MVRLGLLASGRGTNLQAILDACRAQRLPALPTVAIGNNADSEALQRAARYGLPVCHLSGRTHPAPGLLDEAIRDTLLRYRADWVVLAGYLRPVGAKTIAAFRGRIVNIHPGPLPAYGGRGMYGIHVHRAVLAAGERRTAVSVHMVEAEYDSGAVVAERALPVRPDDTAETLAARVLEAEHRFYVETLARIFAGRLAPPPRPPQAPAERARCG